MVIKLGSNPAKARLDAFMTELHELTGEHVFDARARVLDNASIEVSSFDGSIHISDVRAIEPRQGGGTAAMKFLCGLADKHDVKMTLTAKSYSEGRMSTQQLKDWYETFGFTEDDDTMGDEFEGYDMIRYPNT